MWTKSQLNPVSGLLRLCFSEYLGLVFPSRHSYVFDPEFGDDNLGRRLLGDYAVPKYVSSLWHVRPRTAEHATFS
jgi:hypothetical protein